MRLLRMMSVVFISMILLSGCFYAHVVTPLDTNVDKTVLGQKTGKAQSQSVLWAVAWGDAGTAAAAKNGGIITVNHMDREIFSVFFGIYTETTTIVYGD
jgi:hypothetical protein